MSRFYKEDTISIRINPILKLKLHIACWFSWVSSTITFLLNNYIRDYEKQYWIIPITLTNDIKYDVLTKFFWVQLDRQTYKKLNHEAILNLINESLWTNMNIDEFEKALKDYPKTRKNTVGIEWGPIELLEKNNITLIENDKIV